jgi:hypothetical protein
VNSPRRNALLLSRSFNKITESQIPPRGVCQGLSASQQNALRVLCTVNQLGDLAAFFAEGPRG